jgi:DNA-directed RNA polymerase subunit RPC12/RpoP
MKVIDKYPIERMRDKAVRLSFQCPYCKSWRIEMNRPEDMSFFKGVQCPKCKTLVLLDSFSVVVVREGLMEEAH